MEDMKSEFVDEESKKTVSVKPCSAEELVKWLDFCPHYPEGFVRVGEGGYVFLQIFEEAWKKICGLKVRESDVFVASFVRSGK